MISKKVIAAALAVCMSVSVLATGCSTLSDLLKGDNKVKDAADSYMTRLLKGKNTSKFVDGDVKDLDLTDDQISVLKGIGEVATYTIKEADGSSKSGEGKATVEIKYVDAEDIASGMDKLSDILDEIEEAKNTEKETLDLDLVYVNDKWLVSAASDEEAKDFVESLVDDIKLGSEPAPTTEETTTEATETTTETTEETTTTTTTEATSASSESSESSEATSSESKDTEPSSASDKKIANFDEMNFYINGKKYTLGKVTLQQLIDDGVPFDKKVINAKDTVLEKNYQSSGLSFDVADDYYSAQVYVLNDSDSDKPMSECMVNEIYLPVYEDRTQKVLTFDFDYNGLTPDAIKANSGKPDEENTYDSDDGTYHSYKIAYKKKSDRYLKASQYKFEYINDALRYIYIEYIP